MSTQTKNNNQFKLANWQAAYLARELRHKKSVAFSCLDTEADMFLEQLSFFSNSKPIMKTKEYKADSNEVFLEITSRV